MIDYLQIIRTTDQVPVLWSGGVTTQLAIFPPDSMYSLRNFTWRVSTARVDTETSLFTHLPGITRVLMVTEGALTVDHAEHHSASLQPFDQDRFRGEWTTASRGIARDFNLMMTDGCNGVLTACRIGSHSHLPVHIRDERDVKALTGSADIFYAAAGDITCKFNDRTVQVFAGDVAVVYRRDTSPATFTLHNESAEAHATVIHACVRIER